MAAVTEHEIWVRSTDMDADQVVNNARYFEYFEQGRLEHLRRLGVIVRPRPPGEADRSFTIAETTCRYRAPLRHRDVVTVRAWTAEVRNRSFVLAYELVRREDGMVAAEGSSAQVWLDADGKPAVLPKRVREALAGSMGTDGESARASTGAG